MLKWRNRKTLVCLAAPNPKHEDTMNEAANTIVETRAKCNDLPDADYLKECFECDPETGVLIWKRRPVWHFSCSRVASIWNAKYAGREA